MDAPGPALPTTTPDTTPALTTSENGRAVGDVPRRATAPGERPMGRHRAPPRRAARVRPRIAVSLWTRLVRWTGAPGSNRDADGSGEDVAPDQAPVSGLHAGETGAGRRAQDDPDPAGLAVPGADGSPAALDGGAGAAVRR